jgi:hypothetical protein
MSQTLRNITNTVLHVADSLRPEARRRDVPVKRLVCDLLDWIVADQLGDLPSPWKAPRRASRGRWCVSTQTAAFGQQALKTLRISPQIPYSFVSAHGRCSFSMSANPA